MTNNDHDDAAQSLPSSASLPSSTCFRLGAEHGITCIEATCAPSIDEILAVGTKLADSGDHPRRLWDYSAIKFPFSVEELRHLAGEAKQINRQNARVAVLVADDLGYGSMRLLSVHFENDTTSLGVFKDKQKAIDWLNSP